jgi:hypothetical protein
MGRHLGVGLHDGDGARQMAAAIEQLAEVVVDVIHSRQLCLQGEHLGWHDVAGDRRVPVGPLQGPRVGDLRDIPSDLRELADRWCGGRLLVGGRLELRHQLPSA